MTKAHLKTRTASSSTVSDTTVAGAALTHAELDSNLINLRDASWGLADDSSTVLQVSNDKTITIAGGAGISTALSGDTLTITASESQNVFNTIAVSGQSNIVADATTDTLTVAAGTGISITTDAGTDTLTITNTATGTITALNNQAENRITTIGATTTELDGEANLTFDGTTLTLTGQADIDYVRIKDNTISTNASNANLELSANGTGYITLGTDDFDVITTSTRNDYGTNIVWNGTLGSTDRKHVYNVGVKGTLSSDLTSSGGFRTEYRGVLDTNGYDQTATSTQHTRGLMLMNTNGFVQNSGGTASTATEATAINAQLTSSAGSSDQTLTHAQANSAILFGYANTGLTAAITNGYGYVSYGMLNDGGAGSKTLGSMYHFRADKSSIVPGTAEYGFYSNDDDLLNRAGKFERYREKINTLTSSSTITVDCGLAPVHTVSLGTNTQFVISNLGTGQTATIIITNGGSYTGTFGTDGSTAVKFPGGAPTLTASGIDVVSIFNDGTNYLGNIAQAYA